MANVGKIIAGAALVAGIAATAIILGPAALAAAPAEFAAGMALIGLAGATLVASGTEGLLYERPPAHGVTTNNPIKPWDVAYGNVLVPGSYIYLEDNGGILSGGSNTYNKCHNQVIMLACHPIKSVDQVRMNGRAIPLGAGGSGALSTTWTYTPPSNQSQTNISSISRSSGVVTMHLVSGLSGINGQQLNIKFVNDYSFNGVFTVTQPNPADNTIFTYLDGGANATSSGGYVITTYPDWKNRIHCDLTSCLGTHTGTFPELLSTSNLWTPAHQNLGKASVYIAYYYEQTVFANGLPQTSFVIQGKNDIYDPRLGAVTLPAAHVYTTNAALIIADYLCNPIWGYGLTYGTDVPLTPLIAAANLCDEAVPLAAGGTEARYTINMTFSLSQSRGQVLEDMLNACAGRISYVSGQFIITPGAWVGPSLSLTAANLLGPVEYKPFMTITDAYNGVKGTYISPSSSWQSTDVPPYAEDPLHGFTADRWLAADGGSRLWKDITFPATTSCPTAQRISKINLERIRREGRGTLHCDMSAYSATALDVIEFSHPRFGWSSKTFEVLSAKFVMQSGVNGAAPVLGIDLDIAETDSSIYNWTTVEELTPADTPSPAINTGQIVQGPETLVLLSGSTTSYAGADGVVLPRILASWVSADIFIEYTDIEYQKVGDTLWTPAGRVPATQTQCYIRDVVSGSQYNVQAQSYRANGVFSGWAQAGPVTASATATSMSASNVKYPDGTLVSLLQPAQAGADMTAAQAISYTGASGSILPNGTFLLGNIDGWIGAGVGSGSGLSLPISGGGAFSASFTVSPGQKYRFSFTVVCSGSGPNTVTHRVCYASTFTHNIPAITYADLAGFVFSGTLTTFEYDWTCPTGVYFASLAMYNLSGTANLYYSNVSAREYGAAGEWGADVTSSNTAAGIAGQGALATINQANTGNIVAGAVNSQITFSSSVLVNIPANTVTVVAQATITTAGGYVKIRATMMMFGNSSTSYAYAQLILHKGGATDPQLTFYGNVFVPLGITPGGGGSIITIEAIDTSPALAQQYTVTAYSNTVAMQADSITFSCENAKV